MTAAPSDTHTSRFDAFQRAIHRGMVPADISHCIGRKTLLRIVLAEVDRLRDPHHGWRAGPVTDGFSHPFLFTLLGYCYATGCFGSGDIELAARTDPMVGYLCAGSVPDIDVIRLFRRVHHEELVRLLTKVFRRVWQLRFEEPAVDSLPADDYAAASLRRWDGSPTLPDFPSEAEDRLVRAVRADSMALDA